MRALAKRLGHDEEQWGLEKLGISLPDFVDLSPKSMQEISDSLGL